MNSIASGNNRNWDGLEGNWSASYLGIPPTGIYNYSLPDLLLTYT